MAKASYSVDQAAATITRRNVSWNLDFDQGAAVSYAFRSSAGSTPDIPDHNEQISFTRFSAAQIAAARQILQLWADVCGIRFDERTGPSNYSNEASILLANYRDLPDQEAGFTMLPRTGAIDGGHDSVQGDVWINLKYYDPQVIARGDGHYLTLMHELGHAIGLAHPGDYNASDKKAPTYTTSAVYREDSRQYTLMSYFSETETGADYRGITPQTPLLHDIAAAQRLYGSNDGTRTGNTVYGSGATADREVFNFDINRAPVLTIWDSGGYDTLSIANHVWPSGAAPDAQVLDLRQGAFSSTFGFVGDKGAMLVNNVSIAFGTVIEAAIGGPGADHLIGNEVANELEGGGGDDLLFGREGDDRLDGGAGSDLLSGAAGNDWLQGGDGPDELDGGDDDDLLDGGGDDDSLDGGAGRDVLDGGSWGDDRLRGGAGDDVLSGRAGADTLYGGSGRDRLDGGSSDDWLWGDDGDASTAGSADTLEGGNGADHLFGQAGADELSGDGDDDELDGGAGADRLDGGSGNDTLRGAAGADTLAGGDGADVLDGGPGADLMRGGFGDDVYVVDSADDRLSETVVSGGPLVDAFDAGSIDEVRTTLSGYTLPDTAFSVLENLRFIGSSGSFFGTGNSTGNRITGGSGVDILRGEGGDDVLVGNAGGDLLRGGAGSDTLYGGAGVDRFEGGPGDDLFWDVEAQDRPLEAPGEGIDTLRTPARSYTLPPEIENLVMAGESGTVRGTGNASDNVITGLGGPLATSARYRLAGLDGNDHLVGGSALAGDQLDGGRGDDTLEGGLGADVLDGGPGADVLVGGDAPGRDRADYGSAPAGVGLDLAVGGSAGDAAGDRFIGIEDVGGSNHADALRGDALGNRLRGQGGGDTLDGAGGIDTLDGGGGDDTLVSDGLDQLLGGTGIDTAQADASTVAAGWLFVAAGTEVERARGAAGNDTLDASGVGYAMELDGGAGSDRLLGGPAGDTLRGGDDRNDLAGAGGDDLLVGGPLFDTFDGGDGNDTLRGSGGQTAMLGGAGDDLLVGSLTSGNAMEAGPGNDTLVGGDFGDSLQDVNGGDDELHGGGGNDTLVDYAGVNRLYGDDGDDFVVSASALGSRLEGGNGDDVLFAAFGGNVLVGGAGDDRLEVQEGGLIANRFEGGAGADRFVYRVGASVAALVSVLDFEDGIDRIALPFQTFGDLLISDGPDGAVIQHVSAGSPMTLVGIAASQLTEADFVAG
ncbi:MAG: M10 family metallopeptidase C-terminal domain-containing protein [Rubrivivax sp.]